jgi:hypothetical protein
MERSQLRMIFQFLAIPNVSWLATRPTFSELTVDPFLASHQSRSIKVDMLGSSSQPE